MPKTVDIGSKRLISLRPTTWVRWLTDDPTLEVIDLLSGDFQWVSRANDALVKVESPHQGLFLIVNEIQFRPDKRMARRIRAYAALAEERYELNVYPVVVNLLPPAQGTIIDNSYHSEFMSITAHQDFKVINLWEIEVDLVFEKNLMTLLPFVPILKGGQDEAILNQAVTLLRADESLAELEPLLAFFASFVMRTETVQRIMRWDMAILRESPWYEQILAEGLEQGRRQGFQEGLQEGQEEILIRILSRRFGELPSEFVERLRQLKTEQLLQMADIALEAPSLTEVEIFLTNLLTHSEVSS